VLLTVLLMRRYSSLGDIGDLRVVLQTAFWVLRIFIIVY